MSENKPIRSRFFGGFDRRDVVESIKRISDEKNDAVKERDVLKVQLKNALTEKENFEAEFNDLTENFDTALAVADAAMEAKNAELDAKIGEFDAYRAAETVRRMALEQKISGMEDKVAAFETLEKRCAELTNERDALAKECEAYVNGIRETAVAHDAECDALQAANEMLALERDTALAEFDDATAERDMMQAELDAARATQKAINAQFDAFKREVYGNTAKAISLHQAALDVMISALPDEAE